MKSINEYFSEQYINELGLILESETSNNEQRKKELEKWLKGKKMPDYIDTLNKMLEDPKAKILLQNGFGGELGDTKFKFKVEAIPVKNLRPTQSEIDVAKSIDYPLTKPENIDTDYDNGGQKVMLGGFPIITFRSNYVIDGHHRWSQVFAINPDAKMVACNYDADISPIQMLKATQGAIAAVKADDNNNDGEIPSQKVEGQNLFDDKWDKEAIIEHVKEVSAENVPEVFKKYHKDLDDIDKVADFIAENLMSLKSNNYPESDAPNRGDMPQTDCGGTDEKDKKSALPGAEGSALNKLKDGKIVQGAVK